MVQDNAQAVRRAPVVAPRTVVADSVGYRGWYALGVVSLLSVLSFVDRSSLNLMVNPIKADLGISDVQISLLIGLSFSVFHTLLIIPMGYLADRVNRRILLGGAVLVWSSMSTFCGFAGNFWQLFIGRTGLGVGEAALPPSAVSMIRDIFPVERRSQAFSIYYLGPQFGQAFALFIGGSLFAFAGTDAGHAVPILGHLKPWQFVIAVPGLCGFLIAMLLIPLREPRRAALAAQPSDTPGYIDLFRHIGQHWQLYIPILMAGAFNALASSGLGGWLAAALGRKWGMAPPAIGHQLGLISLVCGTTGLMLFGWLMERVVRRGYTDGPVLVAIGASVAYLVSSVMVLLTDSQTTMWIMMGISALVAGAYGVAILTIMSNITPSRLVGKMTAFYFLIVNLGGLAIGPTVVALVSDNLFSGPTAIVPATAPAFGVFTFGTFILLIVLSRGVRHWHQSHTAA